MADEEYMRLSCGRCGVALSGSRKKWCSTRCRQGATMTREEYRQSVKTGAKGWFFCECCGKEAFRKQGGNNKRQGSENRFCSMACKVAAGAKRRAEIEAIRRIGSSARSSAKSVVQLRTRPIRSLAIAIDKVAILKSKTARPCTVCGGPCGGGNMGMPRKYCSKECYKKTEAFEAARRRSRAKRRAVERGCKEARAIDPIKVFDRDGWRCQICLRPTPRKLRGTYKPDAPELDHIVPIAKGGAHVWSNLQCACRSCNGAKSDKTTAGQMGLFTALMQ